MRLDLNFYKESADAVAPKLIGKLLVRKIGNTIIKARITETEAYLGSEDTASHARFGKTKRTKPIFEQGGITYIYLCYGVHYLLNVVTSEKNNPQAVLIRGIENYNGPGKLTKALKIDLKLNEINLITSNELWIEDDGKKFDFTTSKRIGIDYATEYYKNIKWRFKIKK